TAPWLSGCSAVLASLDESGPADSSDSVDSPDSPDSVDSPDSPDSVDSVDSVDGASDSIDSLDSVDSVDGVEAGLSIVRASATPPLNIPIRTTASVARGFFMATASTFRAGHSRRGSRAGTPIVRWFRHARPCRRAPLRWAGLRHRRRHRPPRRLRRARAQLPV